MENRGVGRCVTSRSVWAGWLSQKLEKFRKRAPSTKWVYDFPPPTYAVFVLSVSYSKVNWGEFSERQQTLKRTTGLCIKEQYRPIQQVCTELSIPRSPHPTPPPNMYRSEQLFSNLPKPFYPENSAMKVKVAGITTSRNVSRGVEMRI